MAIFRFFKMASVAILDFKNFKFVMVGTLKKVELHHHAKFSLNRLNRGRDMAIFQDGVRRHFGFWKFQIFNGWDAQNSQLHHRAKFSLNRSNRG